MISDCLRIFKESIWQGHCNIHRTKKVVVDTVDQ